MYVGMGLQATHLTLTFSRTNLFRKDYCIQTRYAPIISRTDLQGLTSSGGRTEEQEQQQQVPHIPRRLHQLGTSTIQAN